MDSSVSVLRLFVKRWRLFISVFFVVIGLGGVFFIATSSKDNSKKSQYIFSIQAKQMLVGGIPSRILTLAINTAIQDIVRSDANQSIRQSVENFDVSIGDVYWVLYEASDDREADEIFTLFVSKLDMQPTIKGYFEYYKNIKERFDANPKSEFMEEAMQKYSSDSQTIKDMQNFIINEEKGNEVLSSGQILLYTKPSFVKDLYITNAMMKVQKNFYNISIAKQIILLVTFGLILATLAVFVAEFWRENRDKILP